MAGIERITRPQHGEARMKNAPLVGVGIYPLNEAARLIGAPRGTLRRWVRGASNFQPLWRSQWDGLSDEVEIGFRDLMEARIIYSLRKIGISLQHIRRALEIARLEFNEERPFSTAKFRTDGKKVFWEAARALGGEDPELMDITNRQMVFWRVVERTFLDIDIEEGTAARWWPLKSRKIIVVDPGRSFGQPVLDEFGIPTRTLIDAVGTEGDIRRVARLFEVPAKYIRSALDFEEKLAA